MKVGQKWWGRDGGGANMKGLVSQDFDWQNKSWKGEVGKGLEDLSPS